MEEYNKLLKEIDDENIYLIETNEIEPLKGLYFDNNIAINSDIDTIAERKCILAEELGHHYNNYGNILDLEDIRNLKQEKLGRAWAFERLMGPDKLINAFNNHVRNRYELAKFLNVTEKFIEDGINYFKSKYGVNYKYNDEYIITFEPLSIIKLII